MTKIAIKNMVCRHCMEAVLKVSRELELDATAVKLGELQVTQKEEDIDFETLRIELQKNGFDLLVDRELQIVEQIKTAVIELIHHSDSLLEVKNSVFLAEKLGLSYTYLSKLFSSHVELTIEKYIILQKIERVKELLSYNEKNLSEIAFDLGYSSVQHLSNQFKAVTGMPVSAYKKLETKPRLPLNELQDKAVS
ncbi:MAG: helix-turn-helix domain-containing protein [Saprospiraceae bacterium]